jgi:hypothetical protein
LCGAKGRSQTQDASPAGGGAVEHALLLHTQAGGGSPRVASSRPKPTRAQQPCLSGSPSNLPQPYVSCSSPLPLRVLPPLLPPQSPRASAASRCLPQTPCSPTPSTLCRSPCWTLQTRVQRVRPFQNIACLPPRRRSGPPFQLGAAPHLHSSLLLIPVHPLPLCTPLTPGASLPQSCWSPCRWPILCPPSP